MKTYKLTIGVSGVLQNRVIEVQVEDDWDEQEIEEYLLERANDYIEVSWVLKNE